MFGDLQFVLFAQISAVILCCLVTVCCILPDKSVYINVSNYTIEGEIYCSNAGWNIVLQNF